MICVRFVPFTVLQFYSCFIFPLHHRVKTQKNFIIYLKYIITYFLYYFQADTYQNIISVKL